MAESLATLLPPHPLSPSNVNVKVLSNYFNVNVNKNSTAVKGVAEVREIARCLSEKLHAPASDYEFFCKVAHRMPEAAIWGHLETVLEAQAAGKIKKSARHFFTYLCLQDYPELRKP